MFKGYFEQYRKVKVNGCDIVGVCASSQSLTPAEVGITAGLTDPRDVLNPILFKACTGDSLNILLDRIYGSTGSDNGSIHEVDAEDSDDIAAYYTMLADDSFRKFHPQGGVRVGGLRPFVHKVASTQPFKWSVGPKVTGSPSTGLGVTEVPVIGGTDGKYASGFGGPNGSNGASASVFISNGLEPMPWLDTTYQIAEQTVSGTPETAPSSMVLASNIPRCYCGVLVLPPAILQPLYFRFSIRWSISFRDFRPAYEIGPINDDTFPETKGLVTGDGQSGPLYYNLYNVESKLNKEFGSFDVNGAESVDLVNSKVQ